METPSLVFVFLFLNSFLLRQEPCQQKIILELSIKQILTVYSNLSAIQQFSV